MMSLGPSGLGSSGLGPWIEAWRTGRASLRWMRAGWLKGGLNDGPGARAIPQFPSAYARATRRKGSRRKRR
jgi:hypothetical protein